MTIEEAKEKGFRNYDPAIRSVSAWNGNEELYMVELECLDPAIHFPTRAKLRAANKAKKMAAATARQKAREAARKAKDDKFPGFRFIGFSGTEAGHTDIYEVFRLDGTRMTVSDTELAKNDGTFFPSEEAARLARIEGYRKAGGRITPEQAKDVGSTAHAERIWYVTGVEDELCAQSESVVATCNSDSYFLELVFRENAFWDEPSATEEARKRRIAWRRKNQMTPITEEQAKDLREGEQFFMLLHGRVEETSCAELARECLSPVQTITDLATGAVVTRPQTFSGSYYWSRKAAEAPKAKATPPAEEMWIERKKADALRKENEELKEKIYFFARTFRYYAGEAFRFYEKHPLSRETDETRAANTTKESEASHE